MDVGWKHAVGLHGRQVDVMSTSLYDVYSCPAEGIGHELCAIESCGVEVVIVVVEQRMPLIGLPGHFGSPLCHYRVERPAHLANGSELGGEEMLWTVCLHTIRIALVVRFARHGMTDEPLSARIYDDACMRVVALPVGHQYDLAGEACSSAENDIAGS